MALAEVAAEGRRWPALTQEEILGRARDRLAPQHSLDEFVGAAIAQTGTRAARTKALAAQAQPFAYETFRAITV